jgi:C-terminal processing protease CtpA/Prc
VAAEYVKSDGAERRRVIEALITNLKEHYVDKDVAQKMVDALLGHEKNGDDNAIAEGGAFAELLTKQMREVSHDVHLEVVYSRDRLPDHPGAPSAESVANYRRALERENCTFEAVRILPHNIGYLKFNSFPDVSICRSTAVAAMAALNGADAVIFDLRDNRGGYPEMVMLIAAYLFDHPEYMYSPREAPTERLWTRSPVAGNRLADKPVYVLISGTTWSAAEQFSYDVKMLKRATLVGERTRGGAHAGVFYRIDDHFGVGIPEVKAVNPFSKNDWEGVGIEPDVKVKAADALEAAERLAESKMRKKEQPR